MLLCISRAAKDKVNLEEVFYKWAPYPAKGKWK